MADENKPAFYPRVGNIKAKNFRSAQPAPFIDDPRAMDLPQFGDVDLSQPTKANLEMSRRIAERDAQLRRQQEADRSPLEKVAGALEAVRFMGSALTQSINSFPTRMVHGDEAAEKFMQDRIYKPTQPVAYEYAQDVGDFLERLETEYKLPPVATGEVLGFAPLIQAGLADAARKGTGAAVRGGMALERGLEPVVRGALERGGLPREMALGMGANTQSNVIKPKGGNWFGTSVEDAMSRLKPYNTPSAEDKAWVAQHKAEWEAKPESDARTRALRAINDEMAVNARNEALNNWVDRNLTNYVKKEMATPEDPVRKLAEEGIVHIPTDQVGINRYKAPKQRELYEGEQLGRSEAAKAWEDASDVAINAPKVEILQSKSFLARNPWIEKLPMEQRVYALNNPASNRQEITGLGFDHILDVLRQDVAAGRIRPEQLNKVSMEQAVRRTYEYDQEMAKRMRETALKQQEGFPVHKEYPEGYKWLELALPKNMKLPEGYSVKPDPITNRKTGTVDTNSYRLVDPEGKLVGWGKTEEEAISSGLGEKVLEDALKYEGNTMGHCVGGYCPDVVAGRSRIFSLRDSKGEPHVTIEVGKNQYAPRWDEVKPYIESAREQVIKDRIANNLPEASADELERLTQAYAFQKAKENSPPNIVQIKGKQNAAPKADYLPYVQDFVKSGNWSDVGDLKNTGLFKADPDELGMHLPTDINLYDVQGKRTDLFKRAKEAGLFPEGQKYLTRGEWEDILRKQYQAENPPKPDVPPAPPAPEMKRGGVAISHNPDTMMLELNNQKMKNGVPAYGAGKAVVKKGLQSVPLPRAVPKTKAEIEAIAQRMAPQMLGEFVRGDKGTQSVAGKTQKQFAKEKEMVHDIRPTDVERPLPKTVDIEKLKDQVMIGIPGDPTISGQSIHSVAGVPLDSPSPQHGGPLYGLGHEGDAFWASGLGAANRVQNIAREASQQYDKPVLGNYVMMGPDSINYAQHYADANLAAIDLSKMSKSQIEDFNKLVREGYPYKKKGEDFTRQRVFPAFPGVENASEAYLHFSIDPELRKHFNALMQMPTITEKYNLPSGIDVRHAVTEPDLRDLEIGVTGKSIGRLRPEVTNLGLSTHPTYSHDIPGEFMGSSKYPVPYELSFPDTVKSVRENPKQAPQEFGSFKYVGPRQIIDQQLIDEIKQYEEMIKKYTGKKKGGSVKKPIKKAAGGDITGDDLIIEERPL